MFFFRFSVGRKNQKFAYGARCHTHKTLITYRDEISEDEYIEGMNFLYVRYIMGA